MKIKTLFLILLLTLVSVSALAATDDFSKVATATQIFKADDFLGAGSTSIPVTIPPGRQNMQPQINLTYSSAYSNGLLGVGWNLNLGYIERSTRNGIPKYDANDIFYISFLGINSELECAKDYDPNEYYPKNTPVIIKFLFKSTYWEAYDKEGRKYIFGKTSDSRIDLPGGTFRWALNKVVDTCGNYMTITYYKDNYQICPYRIEYTGNELTSDLPTNKVEFAYDIRQDIISSYRSGYNITTSFRLREINAYASNNPVSRYSLAYIYSERTKRSLLSSCMRFGSDNITSLPATVFTYDNSPPQDYRFINVTDNLNNKRWNIRRNFGQLWPSTTWTTAQDALTPRGTNLSGATLLMWDFVNSEKTGTFWSVDDKAGLSINLPNIGAFHAYTYVYVDVAKTISIPASGAERFFFWLNGDYSAPINPQNINLKEGPNLLEVTGYNLNAPCAFNLNYALTDNVAKVNTFQFAIPQLIGDFNGDGLSDLGTYYASNGGIRIGISKGETFNPLQIWPVSPYGPFPQYIGMDNMLLGDFDGDTLTDIMAVATNTATELALSKGDHFVDEGAGNAAFPVRGKPFAADFNNDGKTDLGLQAENTNDILVAIKNTYNAFVSSVWLYNFPGKILIGDFNGDGLVDIGSFDASQAKVSIAISKGDGFVAPATWLTNLTVSCVTTSDLNNDGLTDILYYDKINGRIMAAFSEGTKFLSPTVFLSGFSLKNVDVIIQTGDFNGDCSSDFYVFDPLTLKSDLAYSKPYFVDTLNKIENGTGGITSLKYDVSGHSENSGLPFALPVLKEVTLSDGMGNSMTSRYSFQGGLYDKIDREFRGFGCVSITDDEGNRQETYLKQDSVFKGRPYRQDYKDTAGNLYLRIENTWTSLVMKDAGSGVGKLVLLKKQEKQTYDGDASYKTSYTSYDYSYAWGQIPKQAGGDITATYEGGTVITTDGDDIWGNMIYVWSDGDSILTRPSLALNYNYSQGLILHKKQLYYDNNSAIDAKPTKGLLTQEKVFTIIKNNYSNPETSDTYALITTYAYDIYGNMISKTDPENHTTNITYDSTYHEFPVEERNALGQVTKKTYDPRTGQVLTYTDENNQTTTYVYDILGRLNKVIGPNDTMQYPGTIYEYDLSICPIKVIKRQKTANPSTYTSEISFYDGLGRLIETKIDAQNDPLTLEPKQIVKDVVKFNSQGKVEEKYYPFFAVGSNSSYYAPDSSVGKTTFEYDCLARTNKVINPDSTYRTVQYSDWVETKTDENGHQTRSAYDAFGRLVQKDEFNQAEIYTTKYSYDLLELEFIDSSYVYRKAFKIIDAKNNLTTITYDLADRKVTMVDPDMGTWYYTYDKCGNLKTQKDANGQTITFAYDAMNRLTSKLYPDSRTIAYFYDDINKPYCKGRLSYINDLAGRKDFYYDNLGRQIKVTQGIDGISYEIERTYNAAHQVTSLKYPDGETVNYTYNEGNAIEKVEGLTSQGPVPYVTNVDYAATGQMLEVNYGNGTYTDYSYDPLNFRLMGLKTNNGSLQDLNYHYDNVGNIAYINDYRNFASQNFAYDELNRLTSASGVYGNLTYQYDSIGNMINKEGVSLFYGQSGSKPHALTSGSNGLLATYDACGNMLTKNNYTLTYDYDNRLIKHQGTASGDPVTLEIALSPGWNFVSLPLLVDNNSITSVLASINGQYDQVSRFNTTTGKFEYFLNDTNYDQFTTMETGKGYQIYVTNPSGCTLRITGRPLTTSYNISLSTGWQMFGFSSKNRMKISDALIGLVKGTNYDRITRYDKNTQTFVDLSASDYLEPGQAYFLHMLTNSTLIALPSAELAEFAYDADGSRVKKTFNSVSTIYVGELYEKCGSLTTKHIYLYEGTHPLKVASKASQGTVPEVLYYHSDHLGSSNVITDSTGSRVQLSEYKPFGEFSQSTANKTNYYFTGKELDPTSLYYYGARFYDPKIARFISADPIDYSDGDIRAAGGRGFKSFLKNPQNLNRYSYCLNNPIRYIDQSGLYTLIIPGIGSNDIGFSGDLGESLISAGETVKEVYWSGDIFNLSAFNQIENEIIQASEIAESRGEELNIIAHSWGGVLSGYALRETGVKANWITLGTPYFNFSRPKGVMKYLNVIAEGDILAILSILNFSAFQYGVYNVDENDTQTDASYFDIHNYWNNSEVINLILNMLGLNKKNQ